VRDLINFFDLIESELNKTALGLLITRCDAIRTARCGLWCAMRERSATYLGKYAQVHELYELFKEKGIELRIIVVVDVVMALEWPR
jgi:hypothetical protein